MVVTTSRKKICENCSTAVGNACKRCSNCGQLILKRPSSVSIPQYSTTTRQKMLLMKRAQTLHQNHGYHLVVMYYHPPTTRGPTVWDYAATPGLATDSISSSGVIGKSARNVFQTGMKKLWQGTGVALANENGVVCGFGCVSGMSKVHNRPVTPGYLSVFFTSVVPGKTVAPPFPGPFDEDVVRPGESYIWPVDRMFVAGPDDFTHNT